MRFVSLALASLLTTGLLVYPAEVEARKKGDGRETAKHQQNGRKNNRDNNDQQDTEAETESQSSGESFTDPASGQTIILDGDGPLPAGFANLGDTDNSIVALPEPLEAASWPNPKEVTQYVGGETIVYKPEGSAETNEPVSSPGNSGNSNGKPPRDKSRGRTKKIVSLDSNSSLWAAVAAVRGKDKDKDDSDEADSTEFHLRDILFRGKSGSKRKDIKMRLGDPFDSRTTYSTQQDAPGKTHPVKHNRNVLISTVEETDVQMMLSIASDGSATGVAVDSTGQVFQVNQSAEGGELEINEAPEFETPAFTCDEVDVDGRRLDAHLHDEHEHEDGDHHHDHHHDHGLGAGGVFDHHHHDHGLGAGGVFDMLKKETGNLRGGASPSQSRKLYYTDNFPKKYSYQVNMYIDIDQQFVNDAGGGDLQTAIDYVQLLVAGANIVYEREIDTHIHVSNIRLTDIYDGAGGTHAALSILLNEHKGANFAADAGLYHALIGRNLGGGVAYVGAICNSDFGFGVSANLAGNFQSMDAGAIWDQVVFMHEVGHNFGTGHTHSYTPDVDTCGDNACNNVGPAQGTVMSYCHLCGGGISNIAYTMGGARDDNGVWVDHDTNGFSVDPHRVSKTMYDHVSTRGSCVAAPDAPNQGTPAPTTSPKPTNSPAPTNNPTMSPTPAPTASFRPSAGPTVTKAPSSSPSSSPTWSPTDEARLILSNSEYDKFQIVPGFMFDVVAKENIIIHNMEYLMYTGTPVTLDIFTTNGSFQPVKTNSQSNWTQIASVPNLNADGCLDNDRLLPRGSFDPIHLAAGETMGFYFRILETMNQRLALDNQGSSPDGSYIEFLSNNDIAVTSGVFKDNWGHYSGTAYNSYRYTGNIHYTIDGTRTPTDAPTAGPTPSVPTPNPTDSPTSSPSMAKNVLGPSPSTSSTYGTYGHMFDIQAKAEGNGIKITSLDVVLGDEGPPVTLEIFTTSGSHESVHTDASQWTLIATVENLWGSNSWPDNSPVRLPAGAFEPQEVPANSTRAFYIRIKDPLTANNRLQFDNTDNYGAPYFSDSNAVVLKGRNKGCYTYPPDACGFGFTSLATSGFMGNIYYDELVTAPTTASPTKAPVPETAAPVKAPTVAPVTAAPVTSAPVATTDSPTASPTGIPTQAPTNAPTTSPTASPTAVPTPGVHTLSVPSTNSFWLKYGFYFDVRAGETPVLINDIHVRSYYSGRVKVYTHLEPATGTLTDSSQWEQIADTVTSQRSTNIGPLDWSFEPVVVPSNSTRAFYVKSSSYLYGTGSSSANRWTPYVENVAEPSLTLMHARGSGSTEFTTSGDVNMYGAILYQDLGPTSSPTMAPTAAPTVSSAPSISSAPTEYYTTDLSLEGDKCSSCYGGYGQAFEILALNDMQITGLGIHSSTSSAKRVQVLCRHDPFYNGKNHNNFTGGWELLQDTSTYTSNGYKKLTSLPDLDTPIDLKAGEKLSLQVSFVEGSWMRYYKGAGYGNSGAGFPDFVGSENEDLIIYEATRVTDYYGANVNTANSLSKYYKYLFNGAIRYNRRNNNSRISSPTTAASAPAGMTSIGESPPPDGFIEKLVNDETDGGDVDEENMLITDECGDVGDTCFNSEGCCDLLNCLGEGKCGFPSSVSN